MYFEQTQMTLPGVEDDSTRQEKNNSRLSPFIEREVKRVTRYRVRLEHFSGVGVLYQFFSEQNVIRVLDSRVGTRPLADYKRDEGKRWKGYGYKHRSLALIEMKLFMEHGRAYLELFRETVQKNRETLLYPGWRVVGVHTWDVLEYTFEFHEPDRWVVYEFSPETGRFWKPFGIGIHGRQLIQVKGYIRGRFEKFLRAEDTLGVRKDQMDMF